MIRERSVSFFTFPRATKEIGHVCPARRLFVPLMLNSAFNKAEQFFCVGIKSFLVCRIRRHRDIFRFILIGLIIASYVPQGRKSRPLFEQTAETGMLSNAGKDKEVVEAVLPFKGNEEEGVVEPEEETEVEDNTYCNESSVIKR